MRIVLAPSLLSVACLIDFKYNAEKKKYDKVEYINDTMIKNNVVLVYTSAILHVKMVGFRFGYMVSNFERCILPRNSLES